MISIRIFGKLSVSRGGARLEGLHAGKPMELFCYLLLHRDRVHSREALASLLWGDFTTSRSKKHLRQVLWQLQTLLNDGTDSRDTLLVERDSVRFHPESEAWLDVEVFEKAFTVAKATAELSTAQVQLLKEAVGLYQGDLLEGWYQDWCLLERERLQNIYLSMLERLMAYCERHGEHEAGLEFGERSLRLDRAHERTHQQMMRLHYLSGNRTGALRQYLRCEAALWEELAVKPAAQTLQLISQIRGDREELVPAPQTRPVDSGFEEPTAGERTLSHTLAWLLQLRSLLVEIQAQVQKELQVAQGIRPACAPLPPAPETAARRKAS